MILTALAATPSAHATAISNTDVEIDSVTVSVTGGSITDLTWFGYGDASHTQWAYASFSVDPITQTAALLSSVNIPGRVGASAMGKADGVLSGSFMVTGTHGLVGVAIVATGNYSQSLLTDAHGIAGTYITLGALIGNSAEFNITDISVGPNSFFSNSGPTGVSNYAEVPSNHPVDFIIGMHVTSISHNSPVPEPASLSLLLGGVIPIVFRRLRSALR